MKLRPYQWEGVQSVWRYFQNGGTGNPVIAMPTGTGKSLVIAAFLRTVLEQFPHQKIMALTHVKELIEQNYEKLTVIWPNAPAGIYSSGLKRRDTFDNIIFAGIASVAKRAAEFGHVDLVVIDEAHLVSPSATTMYQKFIGELRAYNPHLKVIGLTATPYRLGHGQIIEEGSLFTDVCYDITTLGEFNNLITQGYLAPLIPKRTDLQLNLDEVHTRAGEFIAKELQNAVDKHEITEAACREALEAGHDRKSWLVFAAGVEHAIHTADILCSLGIPAKAVHSGSKEHKMSDAERDEAIAQFKRGELRALVNNNVLTTGFDHPPIDLILMLRPTSSPGLWVQMLGRGTRPLYAEGFDLDTAEGRLAAIANSEKQNCIVLDFGGNTKRLGPINDPVLPPRKGKSKGDAPVKLCEGVTPDQKACATWLHASVRECHICGYEFKFQTKLKQAASPEELIKGDLPVVEVFKVDSISYAEHNKEGRPPMMKVSYYCGLRCFNDFVCFEHEGFAQRKASQWWKERTDIPFPANTREGLNMASKLKIPHYLRIWVNKKYPEIMAYDFEGTEFGTREPDLMEPDVDVVKPYIPSKTKVLEMDDFDDDIPF